MSFHAFALTNPFQNRVFKSGDYILAISKYSKEIGQVSRAIADSMEWQELDCKTGEKVGNSPLSVLACDIKMRV
jgi:hypothetical protein